MASEEIDVSVARLRGDLTITPEEHEDDRAKRLKREDRAALIDDIQRVAVFLVILVALITIGVVAGYEGVISPNASPETQRWCQSVLSAVITGGISFVLGKNSRSK